MKQQCDGCKREFLVEDLGCLRLTDPKGSLVSGCVKDLCQECIGHLRHVLQNVEPLILEQINGNRRLVLGKG